MKVRTFSSAVIRTLGDSFNDIDAKMTEFLGDATIKEVRDTLYRNVVIEEGGTPTGQLMVRVILYTMNKPTT